eukprot:3652009-Prorocentrum_lima.AAC.1
MEELPEPSLRNSQHMEDVSLFVRVMLGEVRLRTDEEITTRASHVSARLHPAHTPIASAVVANPAQKGDGTCNKFLTDDGRPLGRT